MAEQKKVLSDLFGDDISAQARADLAKAGELAARELEEKIYGQERSLYECFGPNPSAEAQAANQRAADLSMQDMVEDSAGALLRAMTPSEEEEDNDTTKRLIAACETVCEGKEKRKLELLTLTIDLEEAIRDIVWESENGDVVSWMQAQQRRDEIRERIYQMIEEGV